MKRNRDGHCGRWQTVRKMTCNGETCGRLVANRRTGERRLLLNLTNRENLR